MKKHLLLLVMLLLPMMACADNVEIDGIYYNLRPIENIATVDINPNKYSGNVIIPEKVEYEGEEYRVTTIRGFAFYDCSGLTSITIPNSVMYIGEWAFDKCSGLTSVNISDLDAWCKIQFYYYNSNPLNFAHHLFLNGEEVKALVIPNSVTSIGDHAFINCKSLTSVTIPNSVTSIGKNAFSGCSGLASVTIPNSVTSIGENAFGGCSGLSVNISDLEAWCKIAFFDFGSNPLSYAHHFFLNGEEVKDLVIPNSVTSIGKNAFSGCSGLASVTIPNSVTSIGENAFGGCSGLTSVTIPNSVTSIGGDAFSGCSGLTSITIPNSVTSIGGYAFAWCTGLTSITIGNSVTSIGICAFYDCGNLLDVYCHAENVPTGSNIFDDAVIRNATLHVPAASISKYQVAEQWKNFKNILEMGALAPIARETTVNMASLSNENLTDNVVGDVYFNVGNDGYDATDGSIVISKSTNMKQIGDNMPGSDDVKNKFNGLILKVAAGKGIITVNVKTIGNAQLVMQVGNDTSMIASKTEQGDVVFSYDVMEDTYVYIYAIVSSNARMTRASSNDVVKIYGITVNPGATGIVEVRHEATAKNRYYRLDGRQIVGEPTAKGIYIIDGRKVMVK